MSPTLRTLTFFALALACVGCRQPRRVREPIRTTREYAALGVSYAFRTGKVVDPVEEGLAYHVDGGYVLFDGVKRRLFGWERARASVELGISFSRFDLDPPVTDEVEADVYRLSLGGRLEWDLEQPLLTPYLRAGIYGRTHRDQELDLPDYDQDGRGLYAGVGVVWWATETVGLGPFATFTRDVNTNNLRETFVGITMLIRSEGRLR